MTSSSSSASLWASDVHTAQQLVQAFRECRNTLSATETNLAALLNISRQKSVLEGAMRRRHHCFEAQTTATSDAETIRDSKTSRVAVAPLGVLVAFTPATSEWLLGQHQDDQQRLVTSLHQAEQKWAQRVQRARQLLGELEDRVVSTAHPASAKNTSASPEHAGAPVKKMTEAAKRKAAAAAYMNSFYGTAEAGSATGSPTLTSPAPKVGTNSHSTTPSHQPAPGVVCSDASCAFYAAKTGLPTLSAVFEGCRGLVACLIRMQTSLQELTLALRTDLMRTASGTHASAAALCRWLEESRREVVLAPSPQTDRDDENNNSSSGGGWRDALAGAGSPWVDDTRAATASCAPQPLAHALGWQEALEEAEVAVPRSWERWSEAYLTEESHVLLAT